MADGAKAEKKKPRRIGRRPKGEVITYNFLVTVKAITGLPSNYDTVSLQHPAAKEALVLNVSHNRAECNHVFDFRRTYASATDKHADAKWRLLSPSGKRIAKVHLNLETLRLEVVKEDKVVERVVQMDDRLGLKVEMEFSFDYFGDDGALSARSAITHSSESASTEVEDYRLVIVTMPPGPLGVSFVSDLRPPTVLRVVGLPDGGDSPLKDKVLPRSELVRFNDLDTQEWGLDEFKDALTRCEGDREMVFRLPPESVPDPNATPVPPTNKDGNADKDQDKDNKEGKGEGAVVAGAAVAGAVVAGAAVAASGQEKEEEKEEKKEEPKEEPKEESKEEPKKESKEESKEEEEESAPPVPPPRQQAQPNKDESKEEEPNNEPNGKPNEEAKEGGKEGEDEGKEGEDGAQPNGVIGEGGEGGKDEQEGKGDGGCEIAIQRYVRAQDDAFILYVVTSQGVAKDKRSVSVLRRYNNFVAVKEQIEKEVGTALPPLPPKYSFTALFNRFSEAFVQARRTELEEWLRGVWGREDARTPALVEFLTLEPEQGFVLDFASKEKLEVVSKPSGALALYKEGDARTPWVPSDSELKKHLDDASVFEGNDKGAQYSVVLTPAQNTAPLPKDEEDRLKSDGGVFE